MKLLFLEEFGKAFVPEKIRPKLRKLLLKAGLSAIPYRLFGAAFYVIIVITLLLFFLKIYPTLQSMGVGVLGFFVFTFLSVAAVIAVLVVLFAIGFYSYVDMKIFNRTQKIEEVLEEFLNLLSENLKGGMGLDRALWNSIRPEFGVLSNEIKIASKKVATGEPIDQALKEFTEKYDSLMTRRSFGLILESMKSGSDVASIIDKVVDNIRETKLLKREMQAANTTYVIFIVAIVLIISPALFALSYQLLEILSDFSTRMGPSLAQTDMIPIDFSDVNIQLSDFLLFSRLCVAVVAVFASMILSLINRGNIRSSVKYIPVFIATAILVHHLLVQVLSNLFGSIFM